jgi:two-component system, sensor histidine kinase and response regulator
MRLGLTSRLLILAGVVALFFVVQFFVTVKSLQSVRTKTDVTERAQAAVVSATRLEKLVLDLETGTRGYVITRDRTFLQPWQSAQQQLPAESHQLEVTAPGPVPTDLEQQWRSYLNDYSRPLVRLVARNPKAAASQIATGEGKRRVDAFRRVADAFIVRQHVAALRAQDSVDRAEHNGIVIGGVGIGVRLALVLLIVWFLLHSVVNPIKRISAATDEIAAGDLSVEVPEVGAGEVGQLARSFNEMARSLEKGRSELATQNVDLERLANVLRAVLDSTVDGILLSDADGNVQLANRPVVNLTRDIGMSYDGPVVDRLLSVADRIKDKETYVASMERLRDNPTDPTFDEFEDVVTGRVFQGFTAPVRDDRGGFLGRIWTLREVTQQRELDRLEDDFVATVSHELRTPLTSMMGFLEMIREGEAGQLTDEQKRFLAIVYRSSERLQRLVGDLLFVARLDASGLQLQFGEAHLDEVARDCFEANAALARSREVDLRNEIGDVPAVWGDRDRLAQLVSNLVSNALKFTPAGGSVTVRVFLDGSNAVLEVADTGIGIPKGEQERLFQRFFRSSTATEQAIPGTGLGLVISKAIAEAHAGSISVQSDTGQGTCFRVELPLEPPEEAAA